MTKKTIVLATNLEGAPGFSLSDPNLKHKYPGGGWIHHLNRIAHDHGHDFVTMKEAIEKDLDPANLLIIAEEHQPMANALIEKGAKGKVLFCMESPLYAPLFYDQINEYRTIYENRLLFSMQGKHQLYFPSFDDEDLKPFCAKDPSKRLVMVASNKHYSTLLGQNSKTFWQTLPDQLQDFRYQCISYFSRFDWFKLYGRGWPNAQECENKIDTIKDYSHSLVIENIQQNDYITEKFFDALVAGSIPLYFGGNLSHFYECRYFEELNRVANYPVFSSYEHDVFSIQSHINMYDNLKPSDIRAIEQARDNFLLKGKGRMHNNQVFAREMFNLVTGD